MAETNEWALYCRVSKRTGMHVENQQPILEQWAKARSLPYRLFTEQESTRKTRPVREGIIQRARAGEFAGIACVKLDRFLRDVGEVVMIKELVDKGIAFSFIQNGLEFDKKSNNATSQLMLHILASFAEFERELIRERTLDGLDRAKSEGTKLGRRKGSKDKKERRKAGYWLRWAGRKSPPVNPPVKSDEASQSKEGG